jgi:hypothetical protein
MEMSIVFNGVITHARSVWRSLQMVLGSGGCAPREAFQVRINLFQDLINPFQYVIDGKEAILQSSLGSSQHFQLKKNIGLCGESIHQGILSGRGAIDALEEEVLGA